LWATINKFDKTWAGNLSTYRSPDIGLRNDHGLKLLSRGTAVTKTAIRDPDVACQGNRCTAVSQRALLEHGHAP
jgi:hypothetical protein